jgi:hypothetical protein
MIRLGAPLAPHAPHISLNLGQIYRPSVDRNSLCTGPLCEIGSIGLCEMLQRGFHLVGSGVLANPPGLKPALESAAPITGILSPVQKICVSTGTLRSCKVMILSEPILNV